MLCPELLSESVSALGVEPRPNTSFLPPAWEKPGSHKHDQVWYEMIKVPLPSA